MAKTPDWDPEKDGAYKELVSRTAKSTKGAQRRTVKGASKVASRTEDLSTYRSKSFGKVLSERQKARNVIGSYMGDTFKGDSPEAKKKQQAALNKDTKNWYTASKDLEKATARKKKLQEMAKKK
jgi:hypothetical protein